MGGSCTVEAVDLSYSWSHRAASRAALVQHPGQGAEDPGL
jgi:hypothetical protein